MRTVIVSLDLDDEEIGDKTDIATWVDVSLGTSLNRATNVTVWDNAADFMADHVQPVAPVIHPRRPRTLTKLFFCTAPDGNANGDDISLFVEAVDAAMAEGIWLEWLHAGDWIDADEGLPEPYTIFELPPMTGQNGPYLWDIDDQTNGEPAVRRAVEK